MVRIVSDRPLSGFDGLVVFPFQQVEGALQRVDVGQFIVQSPRLLGQD